MKYKNSLSQLKKSGYKVFINHHLDEKRTFAQIVDMGNGQEACGEARCSKEDQFNRKIGRHIALGRAYKNLINK